MIETVQAVILNAVDLNDYDKRLTLYTKEFGKIRANVTGVKKAVSKLRALTLPFTESKLQVYLHGGKRTGKNDPGKVVGGEVIQHHSILREDWERRMDSSLICETLEVLTKAFFPNVREYELLSLTLNQLETTAHPLLVRCRFRLALLKLLGYSLRHHATWKSYSQADRSLVESLFRWNTQDTVFQEGEVTLLDRLTDRYLKQYLPYPLKTQLFIQKLNQSQEVRLDCGSWEQV
jgi:DNA repair protein RecO